MNKAISTEQTSANIARVIELLAVIPQKLQHLSQPLSPTQLQQPLAEGKRSFAQDLAHLIHCEARTSEAIYLALLVDQPLLADVHPERDWGNLLHFEEQSFSDLLPYFKLRRSILLKVLQQCSEKDWARTVREESKKRQESVYWKARTQVLHELHHVEIIKSRLNALGWD